jgi:two-component system, NtrC family, response regulator AtoC
VAAPYKYIKIDFTHFPFPTQYLPAIYPVRHSHQNYVIWKILKQHGRLGYNGFEMSFTILIVDDEEEICISLSRILQSKGYSANYQLNPLLVLDDLKTGRTDLIIMDIKMPEMSGLDLLKILKKETPDVPVILISGHATVNDAVQAMKYGVLNIFTKPLKLTDLLGEIGRVARTSEHKREVLSKNRIITRDRMMNELLQLVEKAAPTDAAVIITGESGTGKELVADVLHYLSSRKDKPYIKINCAAIPESLIESEMFGHEKGAFTDAKKRQIGKFELARDGSIFLDEIGDMSLKTQAKMLRVLQEKKFNRIGGSELVHTDCRIIAATNKNLEDEIKTGNFREDLYYRLSVITLHLPPLRDRKSDIPGLADYFLGYFDSVYNKHINKIEQPVLNMLLHYDWPGNVRELKNFIERAVIFTDRDIVGLETIPNQYRKIFTHTPGGRTIQNGYHNKAREIILNALNESEGKKQDAAKLLNISRKTLYNRMKKLNIE